MHFIVVPTGTDLQAVQASVEELTSTMLSPYTAGMSMVTGYRLGESEQYLNSILTAEDVDKLEYGSAIAVFCPTGAGKSWTVERIALSISKSKKVIILTNRRVCKEQLIQEFCQKVGMPPIAAELLDKVTLSDNLSIMTYQQFVRIAHHYHGKEVVLFLDECHCLAEDATFSVYPQQMIRFLHGNLDNTVRIYMTATPDSVISTIWELESYNNKKLIPFSIGNFDHFLMHMPVQDDTRIRKTYLMKSDWSYLTFKTYHPDNREELIAYIGENAQNGKKTFIYLNDIEKGGDLQEQLGSSQHIYSDADKKAELHQIAVNSQFEASTLITTKVSENGLSLHDDTLSVIVAETYDLISLQQIIGRARVSRKKSREIVVLIPDYTATHLGSIASKLYMQLQDFDKATESPDFAMQYLPQPNPYLYYDGITQKPVINRIGRDELQRQMDFIRMLRDEEAEQHHAFVRHVLMLYGKDTDHIGELSISYSTMSACHDRIRTAWDIFKSGNRGQEELRELKDALKSACNETGAYPKELKSNIQTDTINEILRFANISETVLPERKVFDIQ